MKFAAQRDAKGRLMNSAVWQNTEEQESILKKASYSESSHIQVGDELRKEGSNVSLTIDSVIQRVVEEEFDKAKETAQAKNVFGVMMDADSGEILGMGQTTRYNPNADSNISSEALRNVVLQNSFEPGSTFKPIVAAVALDKGLTSKDEIINCENGKYFIGKRMIKDAHPIPTVTFEQVLARSSNIGMAKLGFRLGKDNLYNSLFEFGFGQKTGLELAGESNGIMRNSKKWAQIDIATHSFGQGVSVTALQMVRAYGALANGGTLLTPVIFKSKIGNVPSQRIITEKSAKVIKDALYLVTEDEHGTGKNSRIAGVPVYGKTGTAQKAKENGRGYDPDKILASFIGFVDGRVIGVDRTLVFFVAVDEPGVKPRWGGTLAAPVFKAVVERTLSHLLSQRSLESKDPLYVKLDKTSAFPQS
jgi:cell division protein FtsI (penicillin-binding protein 3)